MLPPYPYPLSYFCDRLRIEKTTLTLRRRDEHSGGGDGRTWSAELSPPLWAGVLSLAVQTVDQAYELEALIDGLDGSRGSFLFADPGYRGPRSGRASDLNSAIVRTIRSDRTGISLAGLPEGFVLSTGDRFSVQYLGDRYYFGRFQEGGTVGAAGTLGVRPIRPYLPMSIAPGAAIELIRPVFKAGVEPRGYAPFEFNLPHGEIAMGGSLQILQKL